MNKRGQESVPVLSAYSLIKTIIAVALLLLVIGIVAVACGFISFAELDSGTKRTFDWMSKQMIIMSQETYIEGKENYPMGYIKKGLAIVWFDVSQDKIDIDGISVKRPLECGELNRGCLAICSVESVGKDSCSGDKLLGKAVFTNPALNLEGKGFVFVGGTKNVIISKDKDTKKLSISF